MSFLGEFRDVFTEQIVAGNCNVLRHEINLQDRPIKQAPRRVPLSMRAEVEKILRDMKEQKVIEESCGPWVSPAVIVKKKDGSLRFCVDYRKLNVATVKNSYPLPRVDDLLAGNTWFSTHGIRSKFVVFWGFYYRKFVRGFASIAKPLCVLTENQTKFIWTEQC